MRKHASRRSELADWTLMVVGFALAGAAAVAARVYASQWAIPLIGCGLVLMALALFAYFRFKTSKRRWYYLGMFGCAFGFVLFLPLLQGWSDLAQALYAGAALVYFIGIFVLLMRLRRATRMIATAVGEIVRLEALFREDGERIMVYANRGKLLRRLIVQVVVLGGFACLLVVTVRYGENIPSVGLITICFGLILAMGAISMLLAFARLFMSAPTLTINADGIIDSGSMMVTGRGLVRWNEILGVREHTVDLKTVAWRDRYSMSLVNGSLDINLTDFRAVLRRQPVWKRALTSVGGGKQILGLRIVPALLDRPAATLISEIQDYIKRHAPPGGYHASMVHADEESDGTTESGAPGSEEALD